MEISGGVVLIFIIVAVAITAASRAMDTDRVTKYVEDQGGRLLEKRWNPFGKGWYGDQNRVYEVRYVDAEGNEHLATCKTSIFSGVYWTDDRIVRRAEPPETTRSLEEENRRLRAEIERLRRGSSS